jgi:hypothetical protein
VFQKTMTYHKSALGAEAIATRSAAVTPKMRSMLILIDGKRGFDELAKLGAMLGDPEQLMTQLADQGLIEPVAGSAAAPAAAPGAGRSSAPAPLAGGAGAAPPAGAKPMTLVEAQRFAVRRLTDMLGPGAEELCMRIEATRTPQEFMAAIHKAESMLRQFGKTERAAQFAADMEAHRPV